MLNWKEDLATRFGLTTSEIHDIQMGHDHDNLKLQRFVLIFSCTRGWGEWWKRSCTQIAIVCGVC